MIFLVRYVRRHGVLPSLPSSHLYNQYVQIDDTDATKETSVNDQFDYRSYIQKESVGDSSADLL